MMRAAYENFLSRVQEETSVKIFGAGKLARTLCLLFDRNHIKVESFIVTDLKENPSELLSRPGIELDSLEPSELCNIVVGFQTEKDIRTTTNLLLTKKATNIIKMPYGIIDDIYCNFVIDEASLDSLCRGLAHEKKVIAYANDLNAKDIIYYFMEKKVCIEGLCTDLKELPFQIELPIISYEQIEDKDTAILLTMNSTGWQRGFITKLRKCGFEKIILIPDELLPIIRDEGRRIFWKDSGFQFISDGNMEKNHYHIEKEQGSKTYRWRVAFTDQRLYGKKSLEMIKEGKLMKEYQQQFPDCSYLPFQEVPLNEVEKENLKIEVYMTKFHNDKEIIQSQMELPDWIIPIQAGKALTDIQVAQVCDNTGDNISAKNADYSEGTALYWIWKNTYGQDYVGLFHYRRQMVLGKDSLKKLMQYDILLTVPNYITETTKEFCCELFILEYDWKLMMEYIKEYDQSYYETALIYEKTYVYFPCNIFIMRRTYFDEMCEFIFDVLEKVSKFYESICMTRKDRYLGYLMEHLLSIYVMHNAKKLKITYTNMKFRHLLEEKT